MLSNTEIALEVVPVLLYESEQLTSLDYREMLAKELLQQSAERERLERLLERIRIAVND